MAQKILITGGAGFIGSHLADELINNGYNVKILDNLSPQVHGEKKSRPSYLNHKAELIIGDVRNPFDVAFALRDADAVFHLAAMVGVGQSMYEIKEYTEVNNIGTAILLEQLLKDPGRKLIVASSMSIYGEGMYQNHKGEISAGHDRKIHQLKNAQWELYDKEGNELIPIPTNENKIPSLASVYALNKYDQERMCLIAGKAYNFPVSALRFFNVYGTRQALSNPYTGVLAIFSSRYLNDKAPLVFEDGKQKRDFVHVKDVTRACRLALENKNADGEVFNIGSGKSITILQIASQLAEMLGKEYLIPEITGKYRAGDIRHCFADISKAKNKLGFEPEINFTDGLNELTEWLEKQVAFDKVDIAREELVTRGLAI